MWSLKPFLCLSMGVSCVYALMFTSLRKKAEKIQGKVLCRGHFLIRQNLQKQAKDWLEIMLLWLFFLVLMYVTVKLAGEIGENGPCQICVLGAESETRHFKLASNNLNPLNVEVPADTISGAMKNLTDWICESK
ncbi:hypothetical protein FD755_024949 [Muntiacus reevesi]|uniref:Uncharacterized protein n=1 Tax=Muntiacus reevesi TaxID=9886 RepID=A0A5N3URR0_MUNRE|nr:hypothetical protein FD755_024949 [Muntiacus reevesi]